VKIGINGNKFVATGDVAVFRGHAQEAADARVDAYWLAQHPAGPTDALTALAIIGRDVPDLELGVGVVPVWGRHPVAMAAQVLTAAQGVPGGLTLGIGLSHPAMVGEHLGDDLYGKPLRTMREYLEILVPLVTTGTVDHAGDLYTCRTTVALAGDGRPTVLVAALGEKMLELAGRLAHGTITSWTGPNTLRDHVVPTITRAAADAGNPPPRIASIFQVCVTDDVEQAREQVHQWFVFHGKAPSYEAMLEREGVESASDVAIVGTEDDVRRRILELADIGVTDLVVGEVLAPGATDTLRTRRLLSELAGIHTSAR
jgi:5,10-methylenetetrahydromethanopterin reductase